VIKCVYDNSSNDDFYSHQMLKVNFFQKLRFGLKLMSSSQALAFNAHSVSHEQVEAKLKRFLHFNPLNVNV